MTWHNLPVVRNPYTGEPVLNNVRPINRSEVIRRIFKTKGNISNNRVHDLLARQGIFVSDSLVSGQRARLF